jgi:hypothetical protein
VNPQDPLANLHPLRQPELIGWWPPAPGWWMLLGIAIIIVAALVYLWRKHRKKNTYRRLALSQLQALRLQFESEEDTSVFIAQVNALLKSVALRAYPRTDVAAKHGAAWRSFLNLSLPPSEELQSDFDEAIYQKHCPSIDVAQVSRSAELWIKNHKGAP